MLPPHSPHDQSRPIRPIASGGTRLRMEKIGVSRFDLADPYHLALTLSWPQFFLGLVAVYLLINFIFALLYYAVPGSVVNMPAGSLTAAFFFSVETLATVGYGNMAPVTLYSHIVSAVEIFVGMVLTATMTGLVFVRFARPKAKVLFADVIVVTRRAGDSRLMIRIGNGRMHSLNDATVRITTIVTSTSSDGQTFRRLVALDLERAELPFFPLTWTVIHPLTEGSPLAALRTMETAGLEASGIRLIVSITARDPALGAQVHAARTYGPTDIALDMRYADAISGNGNDLSVADMRKISDIEADV